MTAPTDEELLSLMTKGEFAAGMARRFYLHDKEDLCALEAACARLHNSGAWDLLELVEPLCATPNVTSSGPPVKAGVGKASSQSGSANRRRYCACSCRGSKTGSHNLAMCHRFTVDAVQKTYGDKSSQWLIDLTHREKPWRDARAGLPDGSRSNVDL